MSKNTINTINPTNEEVIDSYDLIGESSAQQMVRDSAKVFASWSQLPLSKRLQIIKKIGDDLLDKKDELAQLMATEMGKKISQGEDEVELCAGICYWVAEHAETELADENRELEDGRALVSYRPIGVILGIQPWNFPLYQAVRYSIPNLAVGNTVLLKHASNVWGSALALQTIYEQAGLPVNAFKVLLAGHDAVESLVKMPEVRGVTLTGSDEAGQHIASLAGENLKKTVLELGSNDAYIVLKDADIDKAVELCIQGRIYNNGETCIAAKRFIVVEDVYTEFRDAFVKGMQNLTTGDPLTTGDDAPDMGPMAREDLRDTLHEQVTKSVNAGATVAVGGTIPDGKGYFYPATVLENVSKGMPAYDDELFGPVASLIKVADEDEAMHVANDSRYGLGGGIFSTDEAHAIELAKQHFDTGMVNINTYQLAQPNLPFGGVKNSGYGREHGGFGLHEFVNTKTIMIGE